jgi:hypothetical protein
MLERWKKSSQRLALHSDSRQILVLLQINQTSGHLAPLYDGKKTSNLGHALLRAAPLKYGIHIAVRGLRFDNRTRIERAIVQRQRRGQSGKTLITLGSLAWFQRRGAPERLSSSATVAGRKS